MKHNLLMAATLIALAGCNQPKPAATQGTNPVATETPVTATGDATAPPCTGQAGYQLFPAGIGLDVPYHVRADRIYLDKNGQGRRRVMLEFLGGGADTTLASIDKSLVAAGYMSRPRKDQPNGNSITPYIKKGARNIIVILDPNPGAAPSNPAAKGVLSVDYPMDDDAAPAMQTTP